MKKYLPRPWQKVLCWLGPEDGWTVGFRDAVAGRGNTTWHYENRLVGSTYREPEFWAKLPARDSIPPGGKGVVCLNAIVRGELPFRFGAAAPERKRVNKSSEAETKLHTGNKCRFCGCTESHACTPPCAWMVRPQKVNGRYVAGVCSAPPCVMAFNQS